MYHMFFSAGIAGLVFSVIALALVLTTTPAPSYLSDFAASEVQSSLKQRIPAAIKSMRPR